MPAAVLPRFAPLLWFRSSAAKRQPACSPASHRLFSGCSSLCGVGVIMYGLPTEPGWRLPVALAVFPSRPIRDIECFKGPPPWLAPSQPKHRQICSVAAAAAPTAASPRPPPLASRLAVTGESGDRVAGRPRNIPVGGRSRVSHRVLSALLRTLHRHTAPYSLQINCNGCHSHSVPLPVRLGGPALLLVLGSPPLSLPALRSLGDFARCGASQQASRT